MLAFILWCALARGARGTCKVPEQSLVGNGMCDDSISGYNTPECNWDGGDCCEDTCISETYQCGSVGYACRRPISDVCSEHKACSSCAAKVHCGWCATTQLCSPLVSANSSSCPLLETAGPQCDQHSPSLWVAENSVPIRPALYGPDAYAYPPIEGLLKLAEPFDACTTPSSLSGAIALVNHTGNCDYATASLNAQKSGAVAVVIATALFELEGATAPPSFDQARLQIPTVTVSMRAAAHLTRTKLGSPALVGLVAEGPLFLNTSQVVDPSNGIILFDPDYVQTYDEAGRLLKSLHEIHGGNTTVQVPVHMFASTLANKPKFAVIPPQDVGSVVTYMTESERMATYNYVTGGGTLVLFGDRRDYGVQMINTIFDMNLFPAQGVCSDLHQPFEAMAAPGTFFAGPLPERLESASKTYCVLSNTVPPGSSIYYLTDDLKTDVNAGLNLTSLIHLRMGNGSVTWIGFNWKQFPSPLAWEEMLERATRTCGRDGVGGRGACEAPSIPLGASVALMEPDGATAYPHFVFFRNALKKVGLHAPVVNLTQAEMAIDSASNPDPVSMIIIPSTTKRFRQWMGIKMRGLLTKYVHEGGHVLLVGNHVDLANALFGFNIKDNGGCRHGNMNKDVDVLSTPSLRGTSDTYCFSYLPSNATSLYSTEQEHKTMAAVFRVGEGTVFSFGFDFFGLATLDAVKILDEIIAYAKSLRRISERISSDVAATTTTTNEDIYPPVQNAAGCGRANISLSCGSSSSIDIISATFGYDEMDHDTPSSCRRGHGRSHTPSSSSGMCESQKPLEIVSQACQGQSTCIIDANAFKVSPGECAGIPSSSLSTRVRYRCLRGRPRFYNIGQGFCRDKNMHRPTFCSSSSLWEPKACENLCTRFAGCQAYTIDELHHRAVKSHCNLYFDSDGFDERWSNMGFFCSHNNIVDWGTQVSDVRAVQPMGRVPQCFVRSVDLGCMEAEKDSSASSSSSSSMFRLHYPTLSDSNERDMYIMFTERRVGIDGRFGMAAEAARASATTPHHFLIVRNDLTRWQYAVEPASGTSSSSFRWFAFVPRRTDVLIAEFKDHHVKSLKRTGRSPKEKAITLVHGILRGYSDSSSVNVHIYMADKSKFGTVLITPGYVCIGASSAPTLSPTPQPASPMPEPSPAPTMTAPISTTSPTSSSTERWTVTVVLGLDFAQVTDRFKQNFAVQVSDFLKVPVGLLALMFTPGSVTCDVEIRSDTREGVSSRKAAQELAQAGIDELTSALGVQVQSVSDPTEINGGQGASSTSQAHGGDDDETAPDGFMIFVVIMSTFVGLLATCVGAYCICCRRVAASQEDLPLNNYNWQKQTPSVSVGGCPSGAASVSVGVPSVSRGESVVSIEDPSANGAGGNIGGGPETGKSRGYV